MRSMQNNDWIVLNRILLEIYSIESLPQMKENLLYQLKILIDYDSAEIFMYKKDEATPFCEPVFYNAPNDLEKYIKYINISDLTKYCLSGECSDVFTEDEYTAGEFTSTADFEFLFRPYGRHHVMTLLMRDNENIYGIMNLYRKKTAGAFDGRDRFILQMTAPHISQRIYQSTASPGDRGKLSIAQCVHMYSLTRREEMVLRCLLDGTESSEICETLGISNNTLKKHILNLYKKIGIKNRVQMFKKIHE